MTANGEAALYQNGTITDLTPTSSFGQATAINTNGRVAGFFGADGGLDYGAFLWSPVNGLQSLGALPNDPDSSASGINDAGQVVGMSGASAIPTAFLYSNGQMVSLGRFQAVRPAVPTPSMTPARWSDGRALLRAPPTPSSTATES